MFYHLQVLLHFTGETFENWMKRKKPAFEKLDKKTREDKRKKRRDHHKKKQPLVNRRVDVFELVNTDGTAMKVDSPMSYMFAFQKWKRNKNKYEAWKKSRGTESEDVSGLTDRDLLEQRKALVSRGFTYNEWLGQIHREQVSRKNRRTVNRQVIFT